MSYQERVTYIAGMLESLTDAGTVHNRTRMMANFGQFIRAFQDPGTGRINGWSVSRIAPTGEASPRWSETYRLTKFRGIEDAEASELAFQEGLDQAARLFRDQTELPFASIGEGLRITNIDERMFGSVLCHVAECELVVSLYYSDL
ncbi:MAG TPA: hypothetical protein VFI91_13270 [Longimicrobiaceae bacterium]|nr:hypothetical protein [Longimicrobiaceae bacterium]